MAADVLRVLSGGLIVKRACFYILTAIIVMSTLQTSRVLAQDKGAALLEERCSGCHPKSLAESKRKTPKQWQATVSRMIHRGARLNDEENKVLVDYLSEGYKP